MSYEKLTKNELLLELQKCRDKADELETRCIVTEQMVSWLTSFPEMNPNPIICLDGAGNVAYLNKVAAELFPDLKTLGMDHRFLKGLKENIKQLKESLSVYSRELELDDVWYEQELNYLKDVERVWIYSMVITERKLAEKETKKLAMTVEQATDLIVITDKEGAIEFVNESVLNTSGYSREELVGKSAGIFKSGQHDARFFKEMWRTIRSGKSFRNIVINRKKTGELFYVDMTVSPIKDDEGNITKYVSSGKDITEQEGMREQLNYLAYHDVLTDLPNRNLFVERLEQEIIKSERSGDVVSVFLLDLDRFSMLNDTYGQEVGDNILREVSSRLGGILRESDTVARLGNDEFGIIFPDIHQADDLINLIHKINEAISNPYDINGDETKLSVSIGISMYPEDGTDPYGLIHNADISLAEAKSSGGKGYQFFTKAMNEKALEFVQLGSKLANALLNKEYRLYYQPYCDCKSEKLVGMEALLRWHSDEGVIPPGKFIPILEETGMIVEVSEWIIQDACEQLKKWQDEGRPVVPVSINLSPIQFKEQNIADRIEEIVKEYAPDPKLLTFEVTESTFMQDMDFTIEVLQRLKNLGANISIDDFGTGYSSMSYLKRFPVDNLKIDISFIRDITTDPDDRAIVTAIASMAKGLSLKTIAEGVEEKEQLEILQGIDCDMVQGYYYSPPVPAEKADDIFKFA